MAYIGKPFLNVPVNSFAKEDFVGSDTGTNNSIANSLVLSREIPGLNASNVEVFVNNIRQEPDVAYFIKDDANGLPNILEFSEALAGSDEIYIIHKGLGPGTEKSAIAVGSITASLLDDTLKTFTLDTFTGDASTTAFVTSSTFVFGK